MEKLEAHKNYNCNFFTIPKAEYDNKNKLNGFYIIRIVTHNSIYFTFIPSLCGA